MPTVYVLSLFAIMPNNVIYKSQVKGLHYLIYCEATVKCLIENRMPCLAGIIF